MNTISRITLVASVAAAFTIMNSAKGDQVFRSPKLADQHQQMRTVAATGTDPDLAHPAPPKVLLSPRAASNPSLYMVVAGKGGDPDLVHSTGFFAGGSTQAREVYARQVKALGLRNFELAPLK